MKHHKNEKAHTYNDKKQKTDGNEVSRRKHFIDYESNSEEDGVSRKKYNRSEQKRLNLQGQY